MWKIFGNQIKDSIPTIDMTIKRLLIALTFFFGVGLKSGVVYGSSEPVSTVMKTEDYLFNNILKYEGFFEEPEDLFDITSINEGFFEMKIFALKNNLRNISFKLTKGKFKSEFDIFRNSLENNKNDIFLEISSFLNKIKTQNIKVPTNFNLESIVSKTKIKINREIIYNGIVDILLKQGLWSTKNRLYSYSVIRRINDMLLYDDGIVTDLSKKALLDSLNKPVVASRRLLLSSIVDSDLVLNGYLPKKDIMWNEDISTVNVNKKYKLSILEKPDGKQFGFKLRVEDVSSRSMSNFFVKSYMGYYGSAIKFSVGNETSSSPLIINSQEYRSASSTKVINVLDLKEPFVYDLLNKLDFAPEVNFIINPYITGGFFIVTADLNSEAGEKIFFEIGHVAGRPRKTDLATGLENEDIGFIQLFDTELEKVSRTENSVLFTELTKIDMLARIFRLEDFNTGNFGCVVNKKKLYEQGVFTQDSLNDLEFKVIDFATYSKDHNYTNDNINVSFISGNTTINYSEGSIMAKSLKGRQIKEKFFFGFQALQQFNTRIENAQLPEQLGFPELVISQSLEGEVDDKFDTKLRNILALQSQHIKNLMLQQRGTDDKPEEIMLRHPIEWSDIEIDNHATNPIQKTIVRIRRPRTNAELIGFKLGRKTQDSDPNEKELSYLDNAFEDLDNYCQGIMCNYKALKKFITEGYNIYFDEQGNTKTEPIASAE